MLRLEIRVDKYEKMIRRENEIARSAMKLDLRADEFDHVFLLHEFSERGQRY